MDRHNVMIGLRLHLHPQEQSWETSNGLRLYLLIFSFYLYVSLLCPLYNMY